MLNCCTCVGTVEDAVESVILPILSFTLKRYLWNFFNSFFIWVEKCPGCGKRVIDRRGQIGQYVTNELDKNSICPQFGYTLDRDIAPGACHSVPVKG